MDISSELKDFRESCNKVTRARMPFELRYFAIGRHATPMMQYRQILIEADEKFRALENAQISARITELEIEEKKLLMVKDPQFRLEEIKNEKLTLEIIRLKSQLKHQQVLEQGAMKEVLDLYAFIKNEFSEFENKTEEEMYASEKDHWKTRLSDQIQVDIATQGRISAGNLAALKQLPESFQTEIMKLSFNKADEFKALADQAQIESTVERSNPKQLS